MINYDCVPSGSVDCLGMAEQLPFRSSTFRVVITQETLEHVREPRQALAEVNRVMVPGGVLYCQVPFVIGYHPGPTDFWRFTRQGIEQIVTEAGFECDEVAIAVGPATGFYRIAVEFAAVTVARIFGRLYIPTKAAAALLFAPVKLLDPLLLRSDQADRLAGGYYVVAHKNFAGKS
jgi:SAM-dependent methyltransferase